MKKFDDYLEKQLEDNEFKNEYQRLQPELNVIRALVDARTSKKLTQKELAKRCGIDQADISKLENGTRNPSIKLLQRLAESMDMILKIEFVPKNKV
jgi:predicted transcriptional regulator